MKNPTRRAPLAALLAVFAATPLSAQSGQSGASQAVNEAAIELSPFVVQESPDSGYFASQTLAGGRLKQDLSNIGSAIEVVTKEFMNDIGATGIEELLQYTINTEVGGILGNFTGATGDGTPETFTDSARRDPDGTSRVRGLGAPDRTRNFFKTIIPFDSYNTERVEINRGANSFLFGLGSPSGLVNTTMSRAAFKDSNEVGTRIGSGGKNPSYRGSLNINRVLIKDTLAFHTAGLIDRTKYRQEPTFKDEDRAYGAVTYRPFKSTNTVISGHVENGRIRGNAPDVLLPWHALDTFLDHPVVGRLSIDVYDNLQRFRNPEGPSQAQYNALSPEEKLRFPVRDQPTGNTIRPSTFGSSTYGLVYDGSNGPDPGFAYSSILRGADYKRGDPFWDPQNRGGGNPQNLYHGDLFEANGTGWIRAGFLDLETFDFSKANLGWDNDSYTRDFFNYNLSLQQLFWKGKAGFEVAYDFQDIYRTSITQFNTIMSKIQFDINETLLLPLDPNYLETGNVAPLPNPNYGRPFVIGQRDDGRQITDTQQRAGRVTAFVEFDSADVIKTRWLSRLLGRHTLSGLADKSEYDEKFVSFRYVSFGDPDPALHMGPVGSRRVADGSRGVPQMIYIGPPQLNAFTDPNFTIHDFILEPAKYNLTVPPDYSITKLSWNLGPDATNENIGSNTRINGNEGFVEGIFTPRQVPRRATLRETQVESFAVNLQSMLLDNVLVVNTGYREDWVENWINVEPPLVGLDQIPDVSPSAFRLKDGSFTKDESSIFAYGAVLHWPRKLIRLPKWVDGLSFHYNRSDNFIPEADRVDANNRPLDAPAGISKDWGLTLSLMDRKLNVRINWYDNTMANVTSQANPNRIYGNIFQQYTRYMRDIIRLDDNRDGVIDPEVADQLAPGETLAEAFPNFGRVLAAKAHIDSFLTDELKSFYNFEVTSSGDVLYQARGNLRDTQDIQGRGFETSVIYNPTRNWRISLGAAKQETILTNIAPRFDKLLNDFWLPHVLMVADLNLADPAEPPSGQNVLTWNNGQMVEYYTVKGQEGRPQAEGRKWRANLITRYEFGEGRLRGFSVGGSVRWQDRYAYGYPIYTTDTGVLLPVINSPYFAPTETSIDLSFGYRKKILRNVNWSSQINIRNVNNWSNDGVSVIRVQPDGSPARARFDPPCEFVLTNTFRF